MEQLKLSRKWTFKCSKTEALELAIILIILRKFKVNETYSDSVKNMRFIICKQSETAIPNEW